MVDLCADGLRQWNFFLGVPVLTRLFVATLCLGSMAVNVVCGMQQSAEMMKSMSPEDLQRMQEMASATNQDSMLPAQPGVGKKPSSSMGAMWGMADMLKDPKAMKQAMSMMKQMDEEQLANLMKMNQPNMTDEDARRMAQQMKSADDRVLGVLLGGMSALARARAQALSAIQWFLKNPSALFAVVLLVFAVILRYVGIM